MGLGGPPQPWALHQAWGSLSSHAVDGGALLHAVLGDASDGGAVIGNDRGVVPVQAGFLHSSYDSDYTLFPAIFLEAWNLTQTPDDGFGNT